MGGIAGLMNHALTKEPSPRGLQQVTPPTVRARVSHPPRGTGWNGMQRQRKQEPWMPACVKSLVKRDHHRQVCRGPTLRLPWSAPPLSPRQTPAACGTGGSGSPGDAALCPCPWMHSNAWCSRARDHVLPRHHIRPQDPPLPCRCHRPAKWATKRQRTEHYMTRRLGTARIFLQAGISIDTVSGRLDMKDLRRSGSNQCCNPTAELLWVWAITHHHRKTRRKG